LLGVIIANFDKIRAGAKKVWDNLKQWYPPIMAIGKIVDELKEKFGSLAALIKGIGAFVKSVFRGENFEEAKAAMDAMVEKTNNLKKAQEEYNKAFGEEANDAHEKRIQLLEEEGNKQQEILDIEKARYEDKIKKLEEIQKLDAEAFAKDEDKVDALKDANFQLQLLGIKQTNYNKKQAEEAKAAREKAAADAKTAADKAASDKKAAEERQKEINDITARIKFNKEDLKYRSEQLKLTESINDWQTKLTENIGTSGELLKAFVEGANLADILQPSIEGGERLQTIISDAIATNDRLIELNQDRIALVNDELLATGEKQKLLEKLTIEENLLTEAIKINGKNLLGNLDAEALAR
jgi:hypothetical protein